MSGFIQSGRFGGAGGGSFTDDWTGTNGDPWNAAKWTSSFSAGDSTAVINANSGRMISGSSGYQTIRRTAIMASLTDSEMLVSFDTTAIGLDEAYPRVQLRASSDTNEIPANCYEWVLENNGSQISLRKRVAGAESTLSTTVWARNVGLNHLRFQCVGTTIRYRVWADGAGEPGTWASSVTDSSHSSGLGSVGVTGNGARTAHYDNITIGTP